MAETIGKFTFDLEEAFSDCTFAMEKFAHKLYNDVIQNSRQPILTSNMQNHYTIRKFGRNKVQIVQWENYAGVRYESNNTHPEQVEWFEKAIEENESIFDAFIEDIVGDI